MTDAPKLKPCPFCGGKPYLANVQMVGCAYVVCTDCRMQSDDGTESRVVAAWNTRADLIDMDVLRRVEAAIAEQHAYMLLCNDRGDLERNLDDALADLRAMMEKLK